MEANTTTETVATLTQFYMNKGAVFADAQVKIKSYQDLANRTFNDMLDLDKKIIALRNQKPTVQNEKIETAKKRGRPAKVKK